jgi:hypothetical protein
MAEKIEDKQWVKTSFMIPTHAADIFAAQRSNLTSAAQKYTDTTLGGNFAINPPPQFTSTADLKVRGKYAQSKGMGRKYSEMIDDNNQIVHLRFGVPQFNSLTTFFTGFYDTSASMLSRTGRSPGFFYNLGRTAGFVVTLPLMPLIMAGRIYRYLANKPSSKYYYMKPTMPLYWNAVNSIANGIAVNMGIIPRVFTKDKPATGKRPENGSNESEIYDDGKIVDDGPAYSADEIRAYHNLLPDIFNKEGGIDIYAVANRGQRLADRAHERVNEAVIQAETSEELRQQMIEYTNETVSRPGSAFADRNQVLQPGIQTYLSHWKNQQQAEVPPGSGTSMEKGLFDEKGAKEESKGWFSSFVDFTIAEIRDGGQFASFRVNHTGDVGESFSNSAGESAIAGKLNGASSSARSARFSFADGNLSDGGIGKMIGGIISSATDVARGFGDAVGISGLGAIMGNAFVDIPQEWKSASADLPKSTYTMNLRSPYGNKMSRFMNLYVPMSMILAGALPKSAGKHAYDSPFLVEIYDKGRQQVRLGIIDSLQITRGVGNLGWTQNQEPLGIDITFTVLDLSSVLHMPLNASPGILDENSAYSDYLAVLGSLSLADQLYVGSRLRLSLSRKMAEWNSWTSPGKWGMWAANTMPGQVISALSRETSRD